ncbi:hypothetical protein [Paenibacillus sp. YPG26]|uniref:hypothetical protein n=1 Tax=Paenibacillus sp. YPG26 TaxID=2878915 RepID=UPI00203A95CF|nr:hypothetical protein [Paenibacillus sp. YPG26]USB31855.1 hypothetical protein LDO05_10880 [Paenibacillus sp. YPG26]
MRRSSISVPYGYEPPEETRKGTLIFYDIFEQTTDEELEAAAELVKKLDFKKLVLYPLHEETVRRMSKESVTAYHKREQRLYDWKNHTSHSGVVVEGLEGKRKKYTPLEAALRHLTDKYASPYFLYVSPVTANQIAAYSSFEEWIVKLRLLLPVEPQHMHPNLEKYRHRWKTVRESLNRE